MRAVPMIAVLAISACSDSLKNYDKTVSDGTASIPFAAQFEKLFPHSRHFITHYSGREGPQITWNSHTGIADRYILTMQIPITVDRSAGRVTSFGAPKFYLNEVTDVSQLPDGRFKISYGRAIPFGVPEWQSFCEKHGDLSVFGIALPAPPIPRFSEIVNDA